MTIPDAAVPTPLALPRESPSPTGEGSGGRAAPHGSTAVASISTNAFGSTSRTTPTTAMAG